VCDKHSKVKCDICRNWITSAHIHLDFVGHAAVTDRLLRVDPEWTWEPVAFDEGGAPLIRMSGGEASMWIWLNVCGVSRLGVGTASSDTSELPKQLISDALRNAAMRFGVALDLWSKEDLQAVSGAPYLEEGEASAAPADAPDVASGGVSASEYARARSRTSALVAAHISVSDALRAKGLRPLRKKAETEVPEHLAAYCAVLDELEHQLAEQLRSLQDRPTVDDAGAVRAEAP
jgi:hypothetical protein